MLKMERLRRMARPVKKPGTVRIRPVLLLFILATGCSAIPPAYPVRDDPIVPRALLGVPTSDGVRTAAFQETTSSPSAAGQAATPLPEPRPLAFAGMSELSVEALVQEVLTRNPSLAQMAAAWEAASARYPQAISLDDPMLALTLGPATYGSNTVNSAYRINLEQKIPYPGKLRLRGDQASAEARAAGNDLADTRIQLIETAKNAFYEYYLVYRAIAVNNEALRILEDFRKNALTRYETGKAPQQDVLQADVELGRQQERSLTLEQVRQIAVARINTLLSLPPDAPLPLPPGALAVDEVVPQVSALRAAALARRPDLQALAERIAADQAALALANKDFYPDFTPFAMYDRFMGNNSQNQQLAYMVGLSVNVPVRRSRRFAAVAEAQARLNQRRAELDNQINQVNFQVQQAYAQVSQSRKAVRLYEKSVLPAAQANIKAATSAYVTGKINFLSLLETERNLIGLRDRYYELLASYYSRKATLERVIGGPLEPPTPDPTNNLLPPRRIPLN
jgi:outer membrane protein TolC